VSVLLDFIELKGAHSGANMADVVFKSLTELDMKDKVIQQFKICIDPRAHVGI
jgi:hypothetical protein